MKALCALAALAACVTTTTASTTTNSNQPKGPPTVEEARAFYTQVDADLRRLWIARDKAGWVSENFITDDTEALAAAGAGTVCAIFSSVRMRARSGGRSSPSKRVASGIFWPR